MESREADLRRHPRARVRWPVTVDIGDQRLELETMNLSPFGTKLQRTDPPLVPGTQAHLRIVPPRGQPLDVTAIVWRSDPDGPAFFFVSVDTPDFVFPTESASP
jgi:PilZ domain